MAIVIVFNTTLSGVAKPYQGPYYRKDKRSFKNIFTTIAKTGYIETGELNLSEPYANVIKRFAGKNVKIDNRYTCAGLAEILVHVARAIVQLSYFWVHNGERPDKEVQEMVQDDDATEYEDEASDEDEEFPAEEKESYWLSPEKIRTRAIADLGKALGLPRQVAGALVGTVHECASMEDTEMIPVYFWHDGRKPRSGSPSLWDAFYSTHEKDPSHVDDDAQMADDEDEAGEEEDEEEEEEEEEEGEEYAE